MGSWSVEAGQPQDNVFHIPAVQWERVSQGGTGFLAKQAAVFVICLASGYDAARRKADEAK